MGRGITGPEVKSWHRRGERDILLFRRGNAGRGGPIQLHDINGGDTELDERKGDRRGGEAFDSLKRAAARTCLVAAGRDGLRSESCNVSQRRAGPKGGDLDRRARWETGRQDVGRGPQPGRAELRETKGGRLYGAFRRGNRSRTGKKPSTWKEVKDSVRALP